MSDPLRVGLGTDHNYIAMDKATDRIFASFGKNRGAIECVHERAGHRSVLVFIKARE